MKVWFIVGLIAWVVMISVVAGGLGLMEEQEWLHDDPDDMPGFWLWDIVSWIWNTSQFMFHLITFQIPGVPPIVNFVVAFPLMAGLTYVIVRAIRGGG